MVLLGTGTPGTSREIYSDDADGETRTRNPWITTPVLQPLSYTAQLSYCWEGVEFIQLVYCIIYFSFLISELSFLISFLSSEGVYLIGRHSISPSDVQLKHDSVRLLGSESEFDTCKLWHEKMPTNSFKVTNLQCNRLL